MSMPRLRAADPSDAHRVAALVDAAYERYVERIGMRPGPMTEDYAAVIREREVTVADDDGTVVGVIVLAVTDDGFFIDNVAVHPDRQGSGIGRLLLEFAEAEARRAGFGSITLSTHELMTENRERYTTLGYVEYDRRSVGPYDRVFMRKPLP